MFSNTRTRIRILLIITIACIISKYIFRYFTIESSNPDENVIVNQNSMYEEMQQRRTLVQDFCANRLNKTENYKKVNYTLKKMFIDTEHNISWCPVFKAASSTWMKGFAQLGDVLDKKYQRLLEKGVLQWNMVARRAFPINKDINSATYKLKQTKCFVIVRHPFERILSAYRDKLEHRQGREYYFQRYGEQISRLYRQKFIYKEEPTFHEFLTFLAKNKDFDEHWKPVIEQCQPCSIHYDYILKTETLEQDSNFLVNILNLTTIIDVNSKENANPTGVTDLQVAKLYYSNIPRKLLEEIYELYKSDFIMFNYSPDQYYAMTEE